MARGRHAPARRFERMDLTMKTWGKLLAAVLLALVLAVPAGAEGEEASAAVLTTAAVYVNDQRAAISGYTIGGEDYFRLRDLAAALSETSCRFDVTWNQEEKLVEVTRGVPYSGDVSGERLAETAEAAPSTAGLLADRRIMELTGYNVQGSTYYRLGELSDLLGFDVFWAEEDICLYTGLGSGACLTDRSAGEVRQMNREKSTQRWASACRSYLFRQEDVLCVFDVSDGGEGCVLSLDLYERDTYALLESREIPLELDLFGGFCAGEEAYYIVFGCNNMEADDEKEVIRVVKYDRDFNRLGEASVTGGECGILRPFDAGTTRMSEADGQLVIHTSRAAYGGEEERSCQLTLILDTETMEVTNRLALYQDNDVSRSLNQFVLHDGGLHALVDQADACPRGVVLNQYNGASYTAAMLLPIPGEPGAGCTGVTVGGFEASAGSYLVAINTVDHARVAAYTDYTLVGLSPDERDVALLVSPKGNLQPENVAYIQLTDYAGRGLLGSTPYLVKLEEDRFLVLWEEFSYYETDSGAYGARDGGVRYVEVDGAGTPLGPVEALEDARLSYDCQPVYEDGQVLWYVNARAGRIFYGINI